MEQRQIDQCKKLAKWIMESEYTVFFGGAGVSTESGIPDFRSVDGLYSQKYSVPPESILSHTYFLKETDEFFRFYREKMIHVNAKPNMAHQILAKLEENQWCQSVITQNIDGLHQMAGSKKVWELHGSVHRNYCRSCNKEYGLQFMIEHEGIPRCTCGGVIKPDVVLYEEGLDEENIEEAVRLIREADILIVGGTSLGVYPAAGLIDYYRGHKLVLINKSETPYDNRADLLIHDALGEVFSKIG